MIKKGLVLVCVLLSAETAFDAFNISHVKTISSDDAFARGGRRGGGGRRSRGGHSYSGYRSAPVSPSAVSSVGGSASTEAIQKSLQEQGFYAGTIDGKMGPGTRKAIREFQSQNDLKQDGIAGSQTLSKLGLM